MDQVQFISQSCLTLCMSSAMQPMDYSTPGSPVHYQLLELPQTHVHRVSDAIQPSHPLSPLLLLPSVFPSIRVFSSESALHIRWPKYWSFSSSLSPSNELSGWISFRMDWFDLLASKGLSAVLSTAHFESISSLTLGVLYGPALTSAHDHWRNHSFDYVDIPRQSDVSAL